MGQPFVQRSLQNPRRENNINMDLGDGCEQVRWLGLATFGACGVRTSGPNARKVVRYGELQSDTYRAASGQTCSWTHNQYTVTRSPHSPKSKYSSIDGSGRL